MRISDWSSDVCSSDLAFSAGTRSAQGRYLLRHAESPGRGQGSCVALRRAAGCRLAQQFQFKSSARACREPRYTVISDRRGSGYPAAVARRQRSEEHTSELQSLMRISYAVFCLKKTKKY